MNIYDFKVYDNNDNLIDLHDYNGKVLLIVNTATRCGFTKQYNDLEYLYKKYNENGFEILDFPCNQFLKQAPGTSKEIHDFCVANFNITFKQFKKINVNGKDATPLYTYLKDVKPSSLGKRIKWNFTKFLINKNGEVISRYEPNTNPKEIENEIIRLLND